MSVDKEKKTPALVRATHRIEDLLSIIVLAVMALLPLIEFGGRTIIEKGIAGSIPLVEHLTLWIAFLGAALAARSDRHLALSSGSFLPDRLLAYAHLMTGILGAAVSASLFWAAVELVKVMRGVESTVALGIPVWLAMCILPAGFGVIAARFIWHSSDRWWGRSIATLGLAIPAVFGLFPVLQGSGILLPGILVLIAGFLLGLPIFTVIGGMALLLFWNEGIPVVSVPDEAYRFTASPMLPAVPLFALGGYILSEGGAGRRLMRFFTAVVGWMPGGLAVATTLLLALFTPLTGASGITILTLGGLLLPLLLRADYKENFSVGLVTASGSIGLLLPPSLPVILYGVTANISILELFVGGFLPGILLISLMAAWGIRAGILNRSVRKPFQAREAAAATWEAKWDLFLPVVIMGGYFGGFTTLVEASAVSAVYAITIECIVHKQLSLRRAIFRIPVECATLVGGFLIIFGMALGFTNYLILAEIPMQVLDLVQTHVQSPFIFLLALNFLLVIVGGLFDIYSAIFVVVPLITPLAASYGIDPVHLGIIFLANLELGYLTPPMGENLFLSALRFNRPLTTLFRSTVPFWLILLAGVLLITYVPAMSLLAVELFLR